MLIRNVLDLVFANHNQMIYYIDPQNRTIINQEVEAGYSQQLSELSSFEILANRRLDNNFTKQDVFNTQVSGLSLIHILSKDIPMRKKMLIRKHYLLF